MSLTHRLDEFRRNIAYAARQLRRSPTFTAIAVTTLALGIGINAAIFSLVDATLLRPLPLPESERVVMFWERVEPSTHTAVSQPNLARSQSHL
jgi:putative ABC transport system permease protein